MKRLAILFLAAGLLASCDTSTEPIEESPVTTDEDTMVVKASTEPRESERGPTVAAQLPDKDGNDHGALHPAGDRKDDPVQIEGGDPGEVYERYFGENVKAPPTDDEIRGEGDQEEQEPGFEDRYARVSFDVVSSGEITPRRAVVIDGTPTLPVTLTGTWVWVAQVDGSFVEVGAFLDPLVQSTAVFDPATELGYPPNASEGTFRITLSSALFGDDVLNRADFVFFQLDGSLPPDTVFEPATAREVISAGNGRELSVVSGQRVYELLRDSL